MTTENLNHANALAGQALLFLCDSALKSVAVLIAASLVAVCLPKASSATRSFLWLSALLSLLALPVVAVTLPSRVVTPIPASSSAQVGNSSFKSSFPSLAGLSGAPSEPASPDGPQKPAEQKPKHELACWIPPQPSQFLWLGILGLWVAGAALALLRLVAGGVRLWALSPGIKPAEGRIADIASVISAQIGLHRMVRIAQGGSRSAISVPMTWGWRRPVIVLPEEAAQWPEEKLRAALFHELGHVRRGDWPAQLVAQLVCALYWFNPLVWAASARLRQESEKACDDIALGNGVAGSDYATFLLEIARAAGRKRLSMEAATAMASTNRLETRIRSILAASAKRGPSSRKVRAAAVVLACCVVLAFGLIRVVGGQQTLSQPVQPVVASADSSTATLQNGVSVQLKAVGAAPVPSSTVKANYGGIRLSNGKMQTVSILPLYKGPWWKANGEPQSRGYLPPRTWGDTWPLGRLLRYFDVRFAYDLQKQPVITFAGGAQAHRSFTLHYLPKPATTNHPWGSTSNYYVMPNFAFFVTSKGAPPDEQAHLISVWPELSQDVLALQGIFDKGDKSCTSKFAVAAGPWTWSTILPNHIGDSRIQTPAGELLVTLIGDPHNPNVNAGFERGGLAVTVSDVYALDHPAIGKPRVGGVPTYDRRIFAFDSQGRVVADLSGNMNPPYVGGGGSWFYNTTYLTPAQRKQIAQIRLVMRPFQWAEFRDVQLYPKPGA